MDDKNPSLFLPPFQSLDEACAACTHLGVGAHPDDLEVMAGHGILECFESTEKNFFGITCTTGAGSTRSGAFKDLADQELIDLRTQEQWDSAKKGKYAGVQMLGFASQDIKAQWNQQFIDRLKHWIEQTQPQVIYTHNPFDKHQTHVAVVSHLVEALRELKFAPQKFFGCEVWRGLDWLPDSEKQALAISNPGLITELIACHKSQTESGKDYAKATVGRMAANATFFDARELDNCSHQLYAVDLLPLLLNPGLGLMDFAKQKLDPFAKSVEVGLLPFTRGV